MKRNTKVRPLFSAVKQVWQSLFAKRDSNPSQLPWSYLATPQGMQPTPYQQQQTAHPDADSYTDARYYISATLPDTYDATGYASTDIVWTEITLVTEFPEYGPMSDVNKAYPIHGAVKKVKKTADMGGGAMIYLDLPSDAGQVIVKTAASTQVHYSIKVVYSDSETHYLDALVNSCRKSKAASGEFQIRTAQLEFNKTPVEVAAV